MISMKKIANRENLRTKFGDYRTGRGKRLLDGLTGSGSETQSNSGGVFRAVTDTASNIIDRLGIFARAGIFGVGLKTPAGKAGVKKQGV
jgi:hypothetical protein